MILTITFKNGAKRNYPFLFETTWGAEYYKREFKQHPDVADVEIKKVA